MVHEREKDMNDCGFAHVVISEEYVKQTKGDLSAKIKDLCAFECIFLGSIFFLSFLFVFFSELFVLICIIMFSL